MPTEILRPSGNVNTLWGTYDYTNIDDELTYPDSHSQADSAQPGKNDDSEEQAWSFPVPTGEVTSLKVWIVGSAFGGPPKPGWMGVRLKVNGSFVTQQAFTLDARSWNSKEFTDGWSSVSSLEVWLEADPSIEPTEGQRVEVLYVEATTVAGVTDARLSLGLGLGI